MNQQTLAGPARLLSASLLAALLPAASQAKQAPPTPQQGAPAATHQHSEGCSCHHKPGEKLRSQFAPQVASIAPGAHLQAPIGFSFLAAVAHVDLVIDGHGALQGMHRESRHNGPWIPGGQLDLPFGLNVPARATLAAHVTAKAIGNDALGNVIATRTCTLHLVPIDGKFWLSGSSAIDARFQWLANQRAAGLVDATDVEELSRRLVQARQVAAPIVRRPSTTVDQTLDQVLGKRQQQRGPRQPQGEGDFGGNNYTVNGTLQWTDSAGGLHGIPYATVEIRDDELVGSDLITTVTTNGSGQYTATFVWDDGPGQGDADLFIRVLARSSVADIKPDTILASTFQMESAVRNEEPAGTVTFDMTAGNATDADRAFGIHAAMTVSGAYAGILAGVTPSQIDTRFPTTRSTSLFDSGALQLHILSDDAFDWDVIHHEYGHYFQNIHGFQNNPGGSHSFNANLAVTRGSKDLGLRLAWGEGWPTFFGLAAQARLGTSALGIPNVGDVVYHDTVDQNTALNVETTPGLGEDNEVSVMSSLWDLFDGASDGDDKVAIGDDSLFNTFKASGCTTIGAAWDAIASPMSVRNSLPIAAVFGQANIAPVLTAPADGTELGATAPTFTWLPNGAGAANPLNEFSIVFYKDNFATEVLRVDNLTSPTFTPDATQLATLRDAAAVVDWVVEGKNTSAPASPSGTLGFYRSGSRRLGGIQFSFVVDDTGSMSQEIGAVRNGLLQFVQFLQTLPGTSSPTVQLVTFKDSVTERIVSDDLTLVESAVASLSASGGGDCPEFGMQALSYAADSVSPGAIILFATDAASQPGVSATDLVNRLVAKGVTVHTILSGDCGGLDNLVQAPSLSMGDPFAKPGTSEPPQTNIADPGQPAFPYHGDTPATATPIEVNGPPIGGTVSPVSSEDYFSVELQEGFNYDVVVQVLSSGSGTCSVLAPDGTTLLDSFSVFGNLRSLDFEAPSTGTFYVRLQSTGTINYRLATLFDPINSTGSVALFSTISSATGGTFAVRDEVNAGNATAYIATVFNVLAGAVQPALVVALPSQLPRSSSSILTLFGNNTNFVPGSVVLPIPDVTFGTVVVVGTEPTAGAGFGRHRGNRGLHRRDRRDPEWYRHRNGDRHQLARDHTGTDGPGAAVGDPGSRDAR